MRDISECYRDYRKYKDIDPDEASKALGEMLPQVEKLINKKVIEPKLHLKGNSSRTSRMLRDDAEDAIIGDILYEALQKAEERDPTQPGDEPKEWRTFSQFLINRARFEIAHIITISNSQARGGLGQGHGESGEETTQDNQPSRRRINTQSLSDIHTPYVKFEGGSGTSHNIISPERDAAANELTDLLASHMRGYVLKYSSRIVDLVAMHANLLGYTADEIGIRMSPDKPLHHSGIQQRINRLKKDIAPITHRYGAEDRDISKGRFALVAALEIIIKEQGITPFPKKYIEHDERSKPSDSTHAADVDASRNDPNRNQR